ncbi:MAG: glycosyltransferase family 2 protein [Cyanobacteria bacterium]|nr:glycosyltransferase family 2 protein [Cyanobacteriota bacterium]
MSKYYVTIPDLIFKQERAMGSEIFGWVMVASSAGLVTIGGFVSSVFAGRLIPVVQNASKYRLMRSSLPPNFADRVDVMIPAYNEADNIEACVRSVLNSTNLSSKQLSVWVVDDQSSDRTWDILTKLDQEGDDRLQIIQGGDRPTGEVWMGKNWACAQAMDRATGDYVLFIDADVQLKPGAIETAVVAAKTNQWDLLTGWPTIVCGCLGEWIAQPIVASMFALAFQPAEIADAQNESMFAVGPFMLFRRSAYDRVGGHRALRSEIVEDVELARAIQGAGLSLHFGYLGDLALLRMYRTFGALWEGWTKNWHLGSRRNTKATLYSATIAFLVFTLPWLNVGLTTNNLWQAIVSDPWAADPLMTAYSTGNNLQIWCLGLLAIASVILLIPQWQIRQRVNKVMNLSANYWWLSGIGGLVIAAIALASWVKTETGWGWTWRGRSLKLK